MFCLPVGMFANCVHVPVAGFHLHRSFSSVPTSLPPPNTYTNVPSLTPPARYLSGGPVVPVVHVPGAPPPGVHVPVGVAVAVAVAVPVGVDVGVLVAVPVGVGVPPLHGMLLIVSTLTPTAATLLSDAILHLRLMVWPLAAAGRFTVVVM